MKVNLFKKFRQDAGLSQRHVSDHLGYSTPQFISNWERDVSDPPISALPKLAKLYNVDKNLLFDWYLAKVLKETEDSLVRKFKEAR